MIFDADVLIQDAIINVLKVDAGIVTWTTSTPPKYRIFDGELAPSGITLVGPNNTPTPYINVFGGDETTIRMLCDGVALSNVVRTKAWYPGSGHRGPKVGRSHIARVLSQPLVIPGYALVEFDVVKIEVLTDDDRAATQALADIFVHPQVL